MQVTLIIIDDIQLEALEESAAKAGVDIDDLLGRAVGLVLEECRLASREPPSRVAPAWSVDPITKAVTRVESHPQARPEDWDQALGRAKRAAFNPTVEAFHAALADALPTGHGKGGYAFPPGPATDALIKSINGANATNPPTLPDTQDCVVWRAVGMEEAEGKTLQAVEFSSGSSKGGQCLLVFSDRTFSVLGVDRGYERGDEVITEATLDLFQFGDSELIRAGITTAEEMSTLRKQAEGLAEVRSRERQERSDRAEYERLQRKFGPCVTDLPKA